MCGIVGATLPKDKTINKEDVNLLYLLAEERGGHACGYTDKKEIFREPLKSPEFLKKLELKPTNEFIGHTRFKTFGGNTAENAHPFEFDGLVGVHNGSIYNFAELQKKYNQNFTVDSEFTYWMINEFGLKKTLPQLRGWMAFVYWDKKDNDNLVMYRLAKPLFVGEKDGGIYYASLGEYLLTIGCNNVYEIDEHTIYKFKDGVLIEKEKLDVLQKPTVQTKSATGPQHSYEKNHRRDYSNKTEKKVTHEIDKYLNNVPWYAKSSVQENTGRIIFWWPSKTDSVINVKIENAFSIKVYDIAKRDDFDLAMDYPEIYDDVIDDYLKILTTKERVQRVRDGDIV